MKYSLPKLVNSSQFIVHRVRKTLNSQFASWRTILNFKVKPGFTLIELLVVIGVLTILLAIVLVAINPAKQFAQANNTQRRSDVNAILNAVHQYAADNKGTLPTGIDTTTRKICLAGGTVSVAECPVATGVDICATMVPTYLADLPIDPSPTQGEKDPAGSICTAATGYNTGYTVARSAANNRVTVAATGESEGGGPAPTISVTR